MNIPEGMKLLRLYEAKVCATHTQNKGNVFRLNRQRLEYWALEGFDPSSMLKCGCLVEIAMDDVNNTDRL